MKDVRAVLGSLAVWVTGAVLVGVVTCLVLDIVPFRRRSSLAALAVWFVLGVFAGFLHYGFSQSQIKGKDGATDWESADEASRSGGRILAVTFLALAVVSIVCFLLFWSGASRFEVYFLVVPDDMAASLTFFVTLLLTTAFAHHVARPGRPKT